MGPVLIEKVWSPWEAGLLPLAVYAVLAFLTVGSMLLLAARVGKKLPSAEKETPFECGIYPTGSARFPFPVPFYLFAVFFLIFDVEALYVFAWAVAAEPLGWNGWWQISFFLAILLISLFYIWKKGGLEWGPTSQRFRKHRKPDPDQDGPPDQLGPAIQPLAHVLRPVLLFCGGSHGLYFPLRYRSVRGGGPAGVSPPGGPPHRLRDGLQKSGAGGPADLRADGRTQVGHLHGLLRQLRRNVRRLQRSSGDRSDSSRRRVRPRMPAPSRGSAPGARHAPGEDRHGKAFPPRPPSSRRNAGEPEAGSGGRKNQIPGPAGPGVSGDSHPGRRRGSPRFADARHDLMWTPEPRVVAPDSRDQALAAALKDRFGEAILPFPRTADMVSFQVPEGRIGDVLRFLKNEANPRFLRLDDLTAIDESARRDRLPRTAFPGTDGKEIAPEAASGVGPPSSADYTLVYHLLAFDPPARIRLKVPLQGRDPITRTATDLWPSANWYEREVFDMFGIRFEGHPNLRRLLLPHDWQGHPLRKDYPGRATEMPSFSAEDARNHQPLDAGIIAGRVDEEAGEFVLNLGPNHPATHGLMRFVLKLRGEEILGLDMDIGYHHRAAEKIGERQSWHQFIPYTDRIDYLSGAANNLAYLQAVETLAGIKVPPRAQYIRVLLCELFRLSSHLVWFGTFVQDLGAMSPVFYNFRDREKILDIVELITGGRLHPSWFRIGGVAADLPEGWKEAVEDFLGVFPRRLKEYETLITRNPIFRARTRGVGRLSLQDAMEWGVTGPNLRACGLDWDMRKKFPYAAYEDFEFEVPTAQEGDCYARYQVRVEEMRQSLRIIEQAAARMPGGRYIVDDYRYAVPEKKETLKDIESLIHHFIQVTRGPKIPRGEAYAATEAPRGEQGYYVISDGLGAAYRMRIRTPDFANLQVAPLMAAGGTISDLVAIAGSLDYILPDIDR